MNMKLPGARNGIPPPVVVAAAPVAAVAAPELGFSPNSAISAEY